MEGNVNNPQRRNWRGIAAIVVGAGAVILPALIAVASQSAGRDPNVFAPLAILLVGPVYAITGVLIVWRQPSNAVAWMMVMVAVGIAIAGCADLLSPATPPEDPSQWLLLILGVGAVSWVFFIFPILHILLTFPTGRVLSPRWRVFVGIEVAMVSFMLASSVFAETVSSPDESWSVQNPIGLIPDQGPVFWTMWQIGLLILTVAGLSSIVIRFRRSRGVERQQMKVLLFAVAFFAVVYGTAAALPLDEGLGLLDLLLPVAMVGIGVAIAVALLRYRLYEIDRVVSRTVTYAIVAGLLGGAVAVIAALVGTRFSDPLVVAAMTLGVAAVFNPLRRRVQIWVDRRFNRARYDGEHVLDGFAASLRDQTNVDEIVREWVDVVAQTMQPSVAGAWVRS